MSAAVIDYQVTGSFRRDGYFGTAPDGQPAVGDVIHEEIGDTTFSYGDGSETNVLDFKVVAIVPSENYLIGRALAPGSTTDTVLEHDYSKGPLSGSGGYPTSPSPSPPALPTSVTASFDSCCTISTLNNNPDGQYRVQTVVPLTGPTTSPISSLKPIVNVGTSGVQSFSIPATVPVGTTRRYRLATASESCDVCDDPEPAGFAIDPTTGVATLDTTGKALGLYFASVVVEAVGSGGNVVSTAQQTFLINITSSVDNNSAGFYPSSPNPGDYGVTLGGGYPGSNGQNAPDGSTFYAPPTQPFRIKVTASDPTHPASIVHVDNLGLPDGATFTSTDGNPGTGLVEWVPAPGQVGDFIVTFTVSETTPGGTGARQAKALALPNTGGVTSQTISYTFHVAADSTPPVVTPVTLPVCTTSGKLTFAVVDGPGGVGAQALNTTLDGGGLVSHHVPTGGSVDLSVPDEGHHTLTYSGTDLNGNASVKKTAQFLTDRTNPAVSISAASSFTVGETAKATVVAKDAGSLTSDPSGTVVLDTSTVGTHTLDETAKDSCGNVGKKSFAYEVKPGPARVNDSEPTTDKPTETPSPSPSSPTSAPVTPTNEPAPVVGFTPKVKLSKLAAFTLPSSKKCLSKPQLALSLTGGTTLKSVNVIVNGRKTVVQIKHKKKFTVALPKSVKTFKIRLSTAGEQTVNSTYHRCH